jgi:hypothetical protein
VGEQVLLQRLAKRMKCRDLQFTARPPARSLPSCCLAPPPTLGCPGRCITGLPHCPRPYTYAVFSSRPSADDLCTPAGTTSSEPAGGPQEGEAGGREGAPGKRLSSSKRCTRSLLSVGCIGKMSSLLCTCTCLCPSTGHTPSTRHLPKAHTPSGDQAGRRKKVGTLSSANRGWVCALPPPPPSAAVPAPVHPPAKARLLSVCAQYRSRAVSPAGSRYWLTLFFLPPAGGFSAYTLQQVPTGAQRSEMKRSIQDCCTHHRQST